MSETVAELRATGMRRWIGVGTMFGLGALLLWLALSQRFDHFGWQILLLVLAGGALYAAMRMQQATAEHLVLTENGLYDNTGYLLASYDNIRTVERGMLALKPSNGFMIVTETPLKARWRPGLYWVFGRRIGVGGMTSGADAKFVADMMNMQMARGRGDL